MHCTSMVDFDKKVIVQVKAGQDLCFVLSVTVSYSQRKCLQAKLVIIVTLFGKSGLNENCVEPFFIATHLETLECIGEHS